MDRSRLDSMFPNLAARFEEAPLAKRRNAARLACERAVLATGLSAPEVSEAMEFVRGQVGFNRSLDSLHELVATLDDEYFRLEEQGHKERALVSFSRARAASALAFVVTADDTQLHEALYEALSAFDAPTELIRLTEGALASST